jgi:hypothetical protein
VRTPNNDPVVQLHAAHADTQDQVADGATVDAGQAGSGTDADAFAKGRQLTSIYTFRGEERS